MMEDPADVPHQIADAHLPEAAAVFDAATALDTAMDMVAPQPPLVERLVRHGRLSRALLPQIEINLIIRRQRVRDRLLPRHKDDRSTCLCGRLFYLELCRCC
jgi:hypothetical protein